MIASRSRRRKDSSRPSLPDVAFPVTQRHEEAILRQLAVEAVDRRDHAVRPASHQSRISSTSTLAGSVGHATRAISAADRTPWAAPNWPAARRIASR